MEVDSKVREDNLTTYTRCWKPGQFTVLQEIPTPAPDGVQTVFTVANAYDSGKIQPVLDGLIQILTTDYTETSSTTFTMVVPPEADEVLNVNYFKA